MSNQVYKNFEKRIKYPTNTQHIETSNNGDFTLISNNLILNVDEDLLNDDVLTIDNMGIVSKLPIGSLPPNIPDIDFITDDLNEPNNLLSIDSTNTINKSQASTNENGDIIISGKLDVSTISSTSNTTMEKNTEFDDGFIINNGTVDFTNATDIIGISEYDQSLNTTDEVMFEKISIKGASFSPLVDTDVCINSTTIASFNMDASGGLYPSFTMSDRVNNGSGTSMGFGFFRDPSGEARASEIEFIEIAKRHSNKELIIAGSLSSQTLGNPLINVVQIASFSSDEVIIQRPLRLNNIPFQTVLIAQNILTINNLNVIEKSNAVIDTFGNYTSSGFMTVETPTLAPELISEFVLIKEGNNLIRQIPLDDLYGQSLSSTGTPAFTSINIGSATPATDIRSQLKVSGPAGSNTPTYPNENLGGRVEIFNNNNSLPLSSVSAYNSVDQSLAFGTFASVNAPWRKSSSSFFKYQRNNDIFGLYTNNTNAPTGSNATDKAMVIYKNTNLNAVIEFHQQIKILSSPVSTTNTRYLTLDSNDNLQERLLPAFGTGNVDWVGGVSIDNSIPRYDSTTGLIIQGSGVIIDDSNNISTNGRISLLTDTLAPELISDWVLIKQNNNLIKKVSLDSLYGQPLNTLANPTFNNIFISGLLQTDQILEDTLNNGVDVTSWNIKTQKITSDALVNINDPLSINMKYFGDNEIPLSLMAVDHDDISINMDCHRVINSPDTYISGSPQSNFILDKTNDSFSILAQNGIAKGSGFLKSGMQKVAEFFKTSISFNESVNFLSAIIAPNLTLDPENVNDTYFITQNKSTSEILKRDFSPAYGSISGQGNIIETVISTIDVYVPLIGFVGSSDPLRNITIPPLGDSMETINSGLYELHYNISIEPANLAATKLWEVSVFVNGIQSITSSRMCSTTTDAQELSEISNSFMYDGTAGDVFDLRIRNRTNTVNIIMRCATMTIKRLIN